MLHRLLLNLIAVAALTALAALASPWAAAASADVAQVTVVSPGGSEQTLALDALAGSEDVVDRPYVLRSAAGESSQAVSGFSLARILDAAGADPYGFSYLEVQRPAGGAVLLSRDQALADGADGPPAIYSTTTGTAFLRPSTGTEDLNATDSFTAPQGIAIVLRKGTHLQVRATASPRQTRPGKPVHFKAIVEQAASGEQLEYSWYFDDGASATGPEPIHSFKKPGSYDVVIGVTTSGGDETGTSAVVTIQVGPPLGGPNRKGGGHNEAAGAPDHGAASGPSSGSAGPAATTPPSPVGNAPSDTQRGRRPRVRRSTPDRAPAENAPVPPGEHVVGELVSAETTLPPEPSEQQAAARTGHLDSGGGSGDIPTAAWGGLATLGLLALGAAAETGALARLLPRRRLT